MFYLKLIQSCDLVRLACYDVKSHVAVPSVYLSVQFFPVFL